ncbi:unnamed protein product [Caenorhabditis angaria]|uniref:Uncharacterized protein n=1 Tax=Caenorhabditis angaria TaxID=860376 RepID=A0A9P1IZ91_9PELO|nr:unnamed protein product [Caenorhabditis angaria]
MRVLIVLLIAIFALVQSFNYDQLVYEALLDDLEREAVHRDLANRVLHKRQMDLSDRVRRASEKKSYPRNCYFSPIQCLLTRN